MMNTEHGKFIIHRLSFITYSLFFVFHKTPLNLVVEKFVGGDDGCVGQALVELGDLDLFLVFLHFFDRIGVDGELFEFALDFPLQIAGDLAGALADNGNAFVDVTGFFDEFDHVAGLHVGVESLGFAFNIAHSLYG